jgi:hypothetical protein
MDKSTNGWGTDTKERQNNTTPCARESVELAKVIVAEPPTIGTNT